MPAAFDVTMPLPGARFGATVRLTKPLSQGIPEGLPAVLAEADGLLLHPGPAGDRGQARAAGRLSAGSSARRSRTTASR